MNRLNKFYLTLIGCLLFILPTLGQTSYVFHQLTTDDGLSNSNVRAILKDSYGFLWIGTESGLNRYDGYEFDVYRGDPGKENTLSINDIWGLHEDGHGNIWVNSGFTYSIYNRDKDSFINDIPGFLGELGIVVDRNYKVHVDKQGDLWILSGQKAFYYNWSKSLLKVFDINVQIDEVLVNELSDDGTVLYSVLNSGQLWQINKNSGYQTLVDLGKQIDSENTSWYNRIYVDSHKGIWLHSDKTDVIYYQKDAGLEWKEMHLESDLKSESNVVLDIMDDENGRIWIGTDHEGIFVYDRANSTFINLLHDPENSSSVASNNIGKLFKDDRGIIWTGHNKKGISYCHDSFRNFKSVSHKECKDISAILEDKNGNIWLGTDGNGLFLKGDSGKGAIKKMPMSNNAVVSLLEDDAGRIWIGTYLNGLFCYEKGKFTHYTKSNSKLESNDIWSLQQDRYGKIWIGSLGGRIQSLYPDHDLLRSEIKSYEGVTYTLDMFYDGGDKLYAATVYGLCVIDIVTGKQTVMLGNQKGTQNFRQNLLLSVYKDKRDLLWIGHSQGLSLWDIKRDSLYYLDRESGLSDNIIRGFTEDNHQNMWVTTSNGLSVVSLDVNANNEFELKSKNFYTKDGLKDNYFNNHAICKIANGDILLGGTDGYTIVNPNKLAEKNQPPPNVTFTELTIANERIQVDSLYNGKRILERSIEQTNSLTFSYKDKLISLHYTTGDLLNAEKVTYRYRLGGFDDQWHATQENKLVFSSLPPGKYKLYIKAANSDGIWNERPAVLNISVTPPFYLSNASIGFYILALLGAIAYFFYRTRKHHRRKYEEQRLQLVHDQEANLNEMKLRFFTNISHDLRTPLTLIITPLQSILNGELEEGLRKRLQNVHKNAEQLMQLINSLLDFRKLDVGAETLKLNPGEFVSFVKEVCIPFKAYAEEQQMEFTISDEIKELSMKFDGSKVKKILFNLLSNAFKYTPKGGTIDVHLYMEEDLVCISVSDSGEGISESDKGHVFERFYRVKDKKEQSGSGLGLNIVKDYVRMHKGTITVMDNIPQGSIFTFKLPVVEIDMEEQAKETEINPENEQGTSPEESRGTAPVLLFVDDNEDFRDFMFDSLKDEFNVLIASNGKEAVDHLQKNDVDIVVSDVMMPVMSGTELCSRIKSDLKWSHIPVILLTARTAEEYRIEGLEKGADDYLTKPFNFELLRLRIQKFLEWTEKSHASFSQKLDVSPSEITITPLDEQLIEKAIKIVEEHIGDADFSVEELSRDLGLSRSHLYKKLMVITGKGPAEFIRTIRLKRGRQLLEKSQLQVAEVAYAVGFNSPKRFAINFKNEFGASPSEYMRQFK